MKAKKSLGQNFLRDYVVIERIIETAEIKPEDFVLEIGPGTGVLTFALAPRVEKLIAIELDHRLVDRLQQHFVDSKHVSILEGNILDIHLTELIEASGFADHGYKIVANIPYYITAPIIRALLSLCCQPVSMTLMVQNEVAERITALSGEMSLLALMVQFYADVTKALVVPKEAFDPVPQVDSAVIHIVPKRKFLAEEDRKIFHLARIGFSARRKTLANNLAAGLKLSRPTIEEKLMALGLRPDIRAQALSPNDWERLQKILEC